jgi:hypothetical protein
MSRNFFFHFKHCDVSIEKVTILRAMFSRFKTSNLAKLKTRQQLNRQIWFSGGLIGSLFVTFLHFKVEQ